MSFDAWLSQKIQDYRFDMEDATVDFFIAENRLNLKPEKISYIEGYFAKCMTLASIAYANGDESSYVQALRKNYSRMINAAEILKNIDARVKTYKLARHSLKLICKHYNQLGDYQSETQIRSHFASICANNRW